MGVDEPIHADIDPRLPVAQHNFSLRSLTLATHQVEIIFVICTLLGGAHKAEVQVL